MLILLTVLAGLAWVGVQVGLHYYLWRRLVRDTQLGARWRTFATGSIIILGISIPLTMVAARFGSPGFARALGWPAFLWMAAAGLTVALLAMLDLVRVGHRKVRAVAGSVAGDTCKKPEADVDPSRRAFFNRVIGGSAALTAVSFTGAGVYSALRPSIVDVPIRLSRLPASMNGFSITQLTDVHIGNTIGRHFVEDMVNRANELASDIIVITGDLVDGRVRDLEQAAAPLADLSARHGVYFVTGNHEYYSGVDPWVDHLTKLGVRVLRNERVSIGNGTDSFDLAGIDDHGAHRWRGHGADLSAAVAGRDPDRELVLLAHQPRQVKTAVEHGVGLQLSGHTHGGQVWPWHYLAMVQQGGLLAGLSEHGDTQLYVSRGTGYWGPPVRVLAPAEITKVVLTGG